MFKAFEHTVDNRYQYSETSPLPPILCMVIWHDPVASNLSQIWVPCDMGCKILTTAHWLNVLRCHDWSCSTQRK